MSDTAVTAAPPGAEKRRPANTWIVSSYRFQQHHSLKAAEVEAGRLQSRFPAKSFTIYRVKATLEPSDAREKIAALERMLSFKPQSAVPEAEWPREIGENVWLYVVHMNAAVEKDPERRRAEWECWLPGYWTDFNGGGWVWHGMAGTVTHVAAMPMPERPEGR